MNKFTLEAVEYKVVEEYNGYPIVRGNGDLFVFNREKETLFKVSSGRLTPYKRQKAKAYIDWIVITNKKGTKDINQESEVDII